MVTVGLDCRKAMVSTWKAVSLLCINGLSKKLLLVDLHSGTA